MGIVAPGRAEQPHNVGRDLVPHGQHVFWHKASTHNVGTLVIQTYVARHVQPIFLAIRHSVCGNVAVRAFGDHDDFCPKRAGGGCKPLELGFPVVPAAC